MTETEMAVEDNNEVLEGGGPPCFALAVRPHEKRPKKANTRLKCRYLYKFGAARFMVALYQSTNTYSPQGSPSKKTNIC